nr:uncharacterized protein LOC109180246 [Ipomoea batatas]
MDLEWDNTEQTKFGALRSDSADPDVQAPRLATGLAKVDLPVASAKADLPTGSTKADLPSRGNNDSEQSSGDEVAGVEVHIDAETNPVGSDEDLNAPIEISSSFGCQDSSTTMAQMAHVELHGRLKPLIADSKSLKSIKTTHTKEIGGLNSKNAKLEATVDMERKNAEGVAREKSLAREDALAEYKESESDIGEEDYHASYQDAQKQIYEILKFEGMAFSPKKRGYPAWLPDFTPRSDIPATLVHTQGAEDTERVTSVGIDGTEIPMNSTYLNSDANLDTLAGVDHTRFPTHD